MTFTARLLAAGAAAALLTTAGAASAQSSMWSGYTRDSWTGPYIGAFGGFTKQNGNSDERLGFDRNLDGRYGDTVTTGTGANAFSPGFCDGMPYGPVATQGCDGDSIGVHAGVRLGYDYQIGSFVVGAVGDISKESQTDTVTGFSTTPAYYTFTRELDSLAAVRAKVGYAMGPALIYGTGGYAVGKVNNRFSTSNTANSFTTRSDDDKADGWQAGGGVEYALTPNVSLTGEYLYASLDAEDNVIRVGSNGTTPATNPFILAPNTTGTDMIRSNGKFGVHAFNIGLNYRF